MKGSVSFLLIAALHLSVVGFGLSQPGSAEQFEFLSTQGFVKLSAMMEMRQYPEFVSEEWAHVLACSISTRPIRVQHAATAALARRCGHLTRPRHSVLGPLGLVLHLLTRAFVLKDANTILELED